MKMKELFKWMLKDIKVCYKQNTIFILGSLIVFLTLCIVSLPSIIENTIIIDKVEKTKDINDIPMMEEIDIKEKALSLSDVSYMNEIIDEVFSQRKLNPVTLLSIISAESDFNKKAESFLGKDYGLGLMQVSKIGLEEFNNYNSINYTQEDLYNISTNIEVGVFLYNHNKKYIQKKNVYLTIEDLYVAYNVGANSYNKYKDYYFEGYNPLSGKEYLALERFQTINENYTDYLLTISLRPKL